VDDELAIDTAADLVRQARRGLRRRDEPAHMAAAYAAILRAHEAAVEADHGTQTSTCTRLAYASASDIDTPNKEGP
jgi:hypothetical protein